MTLHEEAEKIALLLQTDEGYKRIDDAWMIALGYVKKGNDWQSTNPGWGSGITSCALDPQTGKYFMGDPGEWHAKARYDLLRMFLDGSAAEYERVEKSIVECRLARIEGIAFPLVTIDGAHHYSDADLEKIEALIIKLEIGIPTARASVARFRKNRTA